MKNKCQRLEVEIVYKGNIVKVFKFYDSEKFYFMIADLYSCAKKAVNYAYLKTALERGVVCKKTVFFKQIGNHEIYVVETPKLGLFFTQARINGIVPLDLMVCLDKELSRKGMGYVKQQNPLFTYAHDLYIPINYICKGNKKDANIVNEMSAYIYSEKGVYPVVISQNGLCRLKNEYSHVLTKECIEKIDEALKLFKPQAAEQDKETIIKKTEQISDISDVLKQANRLVEVLNEAHSIIKQLNSSL